MTSDQYGNRYSEGFVNFISCKSGITSFTLNPETKFILGSSEYDYSFLDCRNSIHDIIFPEGSKLEEIQNHAFRLCQNIESIDFSNCKSLKVIGKYAFDDCSSLKQITLNEGLLQILDHAFSSTALSSVHFPSTIQLIGSYSFASPQLTSATYAENCSLTSLTLCAFVNTQMKVLHIPPHLESFHAFVV